MGRLTLGCAFVAVLAAGAAGGIGICLHQTKSARAAQPYAQPVIAMLGQRIARAAPPFGLLAARPTEFCRIARHIGGAVAAAANRRDFRAAGFKGGDGAPSPY